MYSESYSAERFPMKKAVLALGVILISLLPVSTAYAGSLNQYENEVIAEAQKVYEYNGQKYQVDSVYIGQLRDYLSSDDVDLTAEQRDEVLRMAFSSIESGVQQGYLIPVSTSGSSQENNTSGSADTGNNTSADTNQGTSSDSSNTDNATTDNTSSDNQTDSSTDGSTNEGTGVDTSVSTDTGAQNTSDTAASQGNSGTGDTGIGSSGTSVPSGSVTIDGASSGTNSTTGNNASGSGSGSTGHEDSNSQGNYDPNATPEEVIEAILNGSQNIGSAEDANISNPDSNIDDNIIKNTGFSFNSTLFILMGLGMLMLTGIIVTIKSNYFAQNNE